VPRRAQRVDEDVLAARWHLGRAFRFTLGQERRQQRGLGVHVRSMSGGQRADVGPREVGVWRQKVEIEVDSNGYDFTAVARFWALGRGSPCLPRATNHAMTALALAMPTDAELADPLRVLALRARDGEAMAFSQLYERTRQQAFRVLYRVVGPSSDLEDLVQESYVQLMKALRNYRGEAKVSTFVHRICMNVGLMHVRSKRRRPEDLVETMPDGPTDEAESPERAARVQQAQRLTRAALATLSADKAAVFVYHDLMGLKPEEISELVDCPPNTVRSRLNRARQDFSHSMAALLRGAS
jgi:RNA polymerase sigma-70 factor, ECF subfamily